MRTCAQHDQVSCAKQGPAYVPDRAKNPRIYKTESDPDGRQVEFSETWSQMLNGTLPMTRTI